MNQDYFKYLPSEIIIDVLSRLPVRSVACCKCVCKSWLRLVETDVFVKTHLSKSVPGLLFHERFFYLEGGLNLISYGKKPVAKFNLPDRRAICGSSDGLLFLRDPNPKIDGICICNPITRDCIELLELGFPVNYTYGLSCWWVTYGFGTSKISGQHKVVRIYQKYLKWGDWRDISSECHVYTLGTGSWRKIAPGPTFNYGDRPTLFNGNLHWLVYDTNKVQWISCFDLEIELFSTFSVPKGRRFSDVYALEHYLCLNEVTADEEFIRLKKYGFEKLMNASSSKNYGFEKLMNASSSIWLMKEYGVEKSWKKEVIGCYGRLTLDNAILHTPSFLSLKGFVKEKVRSF